ncbi:MAG: hypothetical protein AAFP26_11105 [Planctomycetota bacterium]
MKICVTIAALCAAAGMASAQVATINGSGNVAGNGNSGFGGVIGTGSMDIETLGDGTVNLTLTRGASGHFNNTVIYFDTTGGGVSNTSVLTDTGGGSFDGGRAAISGSGGNGLNADLGFGANFAAEFAISYETGFGGMFSIGADPTNHGFVTTVFGGGADANDATFTMSFNMSDLGLAAGDSFKMVATYLNAFDGFRSGEFIGANDTGPFPADPNIGQNEWILGDEDFILVNSVPSPGALGALGLGGLLAARRRR